MQQGLHRALASEKFHASSVATSWGHARSYCLVSSTGESATGHIHQSSIEAIQTEVSDECSFKPNTTTTSRITRCNGAQTHRSASNPAAAGCAAETLLQPTKALLVGLVVIVRHCAKEGRVRIRIQVSISAPFSNAAWQR